jgi:hypothetical protein
MTWLSLAASETAHGQTLPFSDSLREVFCQKSLLGCVLRRFPAISEGFPFPGFGKHLERKQAGLVVVIGRLSLVIGYCGRKTNITQRLTIRTADGCPARRDRCALRAPDTHCKTAKKAGDKSGRFGKNSGKSPGGSREHGGSIKNAARAAD